MPGPSLGLNLRGLVDWSTAFPFIDQFKLSRPWFTQENGVFNTNEAHLLDLDANGWVKGFTKDGSPPPFDRISTVWTTVGTQMRDGNYVVDWKGEGRLDIPGARIISQAANRIVVDPGETSSITITNTDPNKTGNYIRDIRIYHESDKALLDAGEIFNPAFLEKIEDFRVLRFMDWQGTNNSKVRTWQDMNQPGDLSQSELDGAGASIDVMVALANKVNADPWFTIPHNADASYIRQFATYVRDHLEPGLQARFEFSNEVWNWGFEQARWADQQGKAIWGANTEGAWMQWYGVKAAEMARIVADVFGAETGTRALNVFSTQSGWQGLENYALDAPAHVARGGTPPKDAPFHVYAIAPYFSGGLGGDGMVAQVNTWISQGEAGFKAAIAHLSNDISRNLASVIAYHSNVAKREGWMLEAYEAGQHIVDHAGLFGGTQDPAHTRFFTTLVDRSEFEQLYTQYFNMWKAQGGNLMAHFSDFGAGDKYGSWGIWDSAYSADTSRARAVEAFRDTVEAWWADNRPGSFFNGHGGTIDPVDPPPPPPPPVTAINGTAGNDALYGTAEADTINGLGGNDGLYGRAGNDKLYGGDGHDSIRADIGADLLGGGSGDDKLHGEAGDDRILGGDGHDRLDGGSGADRMEGGAGYDSYVVDSVGDSIVEVAGGGIDIVLSGVSWTLTAHVDELALTGTNALNGTGNNLSNKIYGNDAANALTGLGGADQLSGNGGHDRLVGGMGADRLTGGLGDDAFRFNLAADGGDVITDFRNLLGNNDRFDLAASGFGLGAGALASGRFHARADNVAQDADDRVVFRTTDRTVWFDSNGKEAGGLSLLADLDSGALVTAADFFLV